MNTYLYKLIPFEVFNFANYAEYTNTYLEDVLNFNGLTYAGQNNSSHAYIASSKYHKKDDAISLDVTELNSDEDRAKSSSIKITSDKVTSNNKYVYSILHIPNSEDDFIFNKLNSTNTNNKITMYYKEDSDNNKIPVVFHVNY